MWQRKPGTWISFSGCSNSAAGRGRTSTVGPSPWRRAGATPTSSAGSWTAGATRTGPTRRATRRSCAAAEAGHTVCLKLLLDRKPAVDPRGYLGRTPLLAAAAADRVEAFQLLLAAGADRRAVDDDKNTALHLAASSGSLEIVELLLKTGADPAARNAHGQTPADVAWQKCGFPDAGPPKPQGKVYFRLEAARKK